MLNEFDKKKKEYLDKKFELLKNCDDAINKLKDDYLEEATNAGYAYDEKSKDFVQDSSYILDYQICSLGRIDTKPQYTLIHKVKYLTEETYLDYASYLEQIKVTGVTYIGVTKAKVLAQIFADDVSDFYKVLKKLSTNDHTRGAMLLLDQGLTTRSFTAYYPSDDKVFSYYAGINIVNYSGGFSIRLNNLSATFHLYQVSNTSKDYIEDVLKLENSGRAKETEAFLGVPHVIYKWGS